MKKKLYIVKKIKKQIFDEKGQGMAEYSLILALIALVLLVGFYSPFSDNVRRLFGGIESDIVPAMTGNGT